ncbi:MAG: protein translocase SEC61 complex subunit gamma [Nanoarchaeota archaeon]|nr:protein translocase SEC61 complex subunit gamma [Nanoarchaeota archaeon]MBU1004757.1 protein translocase SEC61 complex subunit gamma [Nanoarchaeota archaeon]MBU1945772.1 protein translocase SEC61 complex subunit gamma [Nanoarchaeota archaeon]
MNLDSIWLRFKSFINECVRVLRVTKKPDKTEFLTIVKVSGLGILIIGLAGFIIQMIKVLFFQQG